MGGSYPQVVKQIADSDYREIKSEITGNDYALYIWLPPGYSESEDRYPAVYIVDGQ